MISMRTANRLTFTAVIKAIERKFTNCLQQKEPILFRSTHKALVNERRDDFDVCITNGRRRGKIEASCENTKPREHATLACAQQIEAPLHRRAEAPLTCGRVSRPAGQEAKP